MFFYVTFCGLDLPANMLTKKIGPHITLPSMMVGWWVSFPLFTLQALTVSQGNHDSSLSGRLQLGWTASLPHLHGSL